MDFKRDWWRILLTVVVVWLVFIMDLEGRSFAGHLWRIANTPETHELGEAIGDKFATLFHGVRHRLGVAYDDYYDDWGHGGGRHSHR
jgi:hypothetical protein